MNYEDMSTEELEKAFLEAKSQETNEESNLEKGEPDNGMLREEKLSEEGLRGQEEEISSDSEPNNEGETPLKDNEIEYETNDNNPTEEPLVTNNEEVTQESVNNTLYKIKANGKEYDMTLDELKQTASKGMDYLRKTTALKPYRTMIAAMEQNKVSPEDINLLIDLKKGNKEAIAKLIKDNEVDVYDLPEANNYTPQEYRTSESEYEIREVVNQLSQDADIFSRTSQVYSNMDETSKQVINSNPQMLAGLQQDIKSGLFDKVMPIAEKKAVVDGFSKPFLEYYLSDG